jgi:hypothetical protein
VDDDRRKGRGAVGGRTYLDLDGVRVRRGGGDRRRDLPAKLAGGEFIRGRRAGRAGPRQLALALALALKLLRSEAINK